MADANDSAPALFPDRFVTIQESYRYRTIKSILRNKHRPKKPPPLYPWIKLSGRWIETAGFEPAQRVRIEVTERRLVITPMEETYLDLKGRPEFPIVDTETGLRRRRHPAGMEEADVRSR
ncbi:type I toxin-antitoxin system SymE family toxin [Burkholderia sp. MS455]|uniref:Toxic protein SymE n=1 Tax=Burkholderia pyrrocinia TaxID=60550 RepID=A0A318IPW6_BURPY|nr:MULTISPECIES: SymE family type I addiction module toxin [Burkholderia]PXX38126.1 toxic protein SymE [Burkholderia pyrrocinia]QRR05936.1 type I toxin-antitoxin system SymE family toxin [Burkholderia sp. MS455]SFW52995.1 toxic protein SymE [Burkholderia sp. NFACC33-1]SFX59255.1 toxic protein SymE [Burkholderia sp. NFPP32]